MTDLDNYEPDHEIELKVLSAFKIQDPDNSFIERLQIELTDRFITTSKSPLDTDITTGRPKWIRQIKTLFSPLAWTAVAFIFIISLIWAINTLVPRLVPGGRFKPSPSPIVLSTPQPTAISFTSMENVLFYTVEAGDTLSSIEKKTNVTMETLQNLNAFILQNNELTPGLKLVIGFKGQSPVFYTVQEGDTIQEISDQAGISIEEFAAMNRIGFYSSNMLTPFPIPNFILTPGTQVIIGLENKTMNENGGSGDESSILAEVDLNCDNKMERILGNEAPEIEYFNITPQLSMISLEMADGTGYEKVWEQTAQQAGVSYLAYQLFRADECNQFLVVIGHNGKETVSVFHWNGVRLINILERTGTFLFEGSWMEDVFGDYKTTLNTLYLGELQKSTNSSKNIWILREYQWRDGIFKQINERRVELNGGG